MTDLRNPTSLQAVALFEVSWCEGTDRHTVQTTTREDALSLFAALDAAKGFSDVRLERSRWTRWTPVTGNLAASPAGEEPQP